MAGGNGSEGIGSLLLLVGQRAVAVGDVPRLDPCTYQLGHLKLRYTLQHLEREREREREREYNT